MTKSHSDRGHWAALLLMLAFGTLLRTIAIGRESLWADEALTPVLAHWPVWEMATQPTDPTPFLYYFLHQLLIPESASAACMRAVSLAAGVAGIAAIYVLGRLAFGCRQGLIAAALLAVAAPHVDYSQEARAYALLVLLTLLSAVGLLWWFREIEGLGRPLRRRAALALFAGATVLAFYTHLVAVFWIALALQILLSLTLREGLPQHRREISWAMVAMALLAMPGVVRMMRQLTIPDGFHWLAQAGPFEALGIAGDMFLPSGLWRDTGTSAWLIGSAVIALAFLAATRRARLRAWVREHSAPAAVIGALLLLPLLIWLFGFCVRPLFMPRTILFALPGAILLIVGLLGTLKARLALPAAVAVVGLYLGATLLTGTTRPKEDWRGAATMLSRAVRPGDVVLICPGWKYPALRHAMQKAVPAPALLPLADSTLMIESRLGAASGWSATYFRSQAAPPVRYLARGEQLPMLAAHRLQLPAGASAWLVGSECSREESAALAAWLEAGDAGIVAWRSPAGRDHQSITIWRIALPQARSFVTHLPL